MLSAQACNARREIASPPILDKGPGLCYIEGVARYAIANIGQACTARTYESEVTRMPEHATQCDVVPGCTQPIVSAGRRHAVCEEHGRMLCQVAMCTRWTLHEQDDCEFTPPTGEPVEIWLFPQGKKLVMRRIGGIEFLDDEENAKDDPQ